MTLEGHGGSDYVLLSYDVRGAERSRAVEVCRIVFGRHRRAVSKHDRTKTENGFIHRPGVVGVGQSVLFLPPRDGEELEGKLRAMGVRVSSARLPIGRATLEAFRRPR